MQGNLLKELKIIDKGFLEIIKTENLYVSLKSGDYSTDPEIHSGFTTRNSYNVELLRQVYDLYTQGDLYLDDFVENFGFSNSKTLLKTFRKPKYNFPKISKDVKKFYADRTLEKRKQSTLEKYGVDNVSKISTVRKKAKETMLERFGTDKIPEISEQSETTKTIRVKPDKKHGKVENSTFQANSLENFSNPEIAAKELLESFSENIKDLKLNYRPAFLDGVELDFYVETTSRKRLALEINSVFQSCSKPKNFNQEKKIKCSENDVELLSFTDVDFFEKFEIISGILKNRLGLTSRKIFARKCEIRKLENKDVKEFLNLYHFQGFTIANLTFGLFFEDELVQVASFSPSRFGNAEERKNFELIRLCTKADTNVVGGFSKLLKHFKKTYNVDVVTTFADANISDLSSCVYAKLPNSVYLGICEPDLSFFYGGKKFSRQKMMKHNLWKTFPEFPKREDPMYKDFTTTKFYNDVGILSYYGCGNYKFLI